RERASLEPEAAHEADSDPAGAEMALEDGQLGQVAGGVRDDQAVGDGRLLGEGLRDDLARNDADDPDLPAPGGDREALAVEAADPNGVPHPVRHVRPLDRFERAAMCE